LAYDRTGVNIAILWTPAYPDNSGKSCYALSYTLANAYGLFWNFDTNTLVVDNINNAKTYKNMMLAFNSNGYFAEGKFQKYLLNPVSSDVDALKGKTNGISNHVFMSRQCMLDGYPENSIAGAINAKNKGYDNVRVSVRFTSDGVPVLLHDASINAVVRNTDGTVISSTVNIADITLAQSDTYDWGIYYGTQFAGTKTPTLDKFLKVCAYKGIYPTLEIKPATITQSQAQMIADMVIKYGLTKATTISSDTVSVLQSVFNLNKNINVAQICHPSTAVVDSVLQFRYKQNKLRLDIFDSDTVDNTFLYYASQNDVDIKLGSCYDIASVASWLEKGVTIIEIANVPYPQKALSDYYDSNF
jgi:glycerophosphoryl diester phosphodiesterase